MSRETRRLTAFRADPQELKRLDKVAKILSRKHRGDVHITRSEVIRMAVAYFCKKMLGEEQ